MLFCSHKGASIAGCFLGISGFECLSVLDLNSEPDAEINLISGTTLNLKMFQVLWIVALYLLVITADILEKECFVPAVSSLCFTDNLVVMLTAIISLLLSPSQHISNILESIQLT